jgi:hypothetical protein
LYYILRNSKNINEIKVAIDYLRLLGLINNKSDSKTDVEFSICRQDERVAKKFYIFGPNSEHPPTEQFFNYTLVLTKIPNFDFSGFKECYLFLNHHTYLRLSSEKLSEIERSYTKVFINAKSHLIKKPFIPIASLGGGNVASLMGVQRLVLVLTALHPGSSYRVEGFDLYVSDSAYTGIISTYLPIHDYRKTEKLLAISLFVHDPVYNFLKLREMLKKEEMSIDPFLGELLSGSASDYFARLAKARRLDWAA